MWECSWDVSIDMKMKLELIDATYRGSTWNSRYWIKLIVEKNLQFHLRSHLKTTPSSSPVASIQDNIFFKNKFQIKIINLNKKNPHQNGCNLYYSFFPPKTNKNKSVTVYRSL